MTIDPDDQHLLALARAIDDESPIDWRVEESAASAEALAVLSELRVLHGVARVARDPSDQATTRSAGDGPAVEPHRPVGRWGLLTILEEIGRGVFGCVYRARDNLGRDVALKLFRNPADSARLLREGQLLARVRHANVIDVYGAGEFDGQVGMWMEMIRGRTLEDELRLRGTLGAEEARLIGLDLCRALAAVHEAGLVHRDVKAQNVMREEGGRIVLMDFGAGVATEAGDQRDVAGTPMYLAPEVFSGQPASRVSDIYSLGVLLYHLVTGMYPMWGATRAAIEQAHAEGRSRRLRDARPDLPEGFVRVVEIALASDPLHRYQTAGEFEHALLDQKQPVRAPARPSPRRLSPPTMAAVGLLVALAIVAMFVPWLRDGRKVDPVVTPTPSPAPADGSYTVSGVFYRYSNGQRTHLDPDARVTPGDQLGFEITTSVPAFVYVINEDDHGEAYLLFPLPGQSPSNPLSANTVHRLPGGPNGQDVHWQVTSAGGREHFVVYVSPDHIAIFDGLLQSLPHPVQGRPIGGPRLPASALSRLRGLGGLVSKASTPSTPSSAHYLFEGAAPLGTKPETTRGTWVRQITLQNPGS